jgi:hypothetical protein
MVQALESDSISGNRAIYLKNTGDVSPEDDDELESDSVSGNEKIIVDNSDDLESDSISGEISIRK